jgi:hypothetical protein
MFNANYCVFIGAYAEKPVKSGKKNNRETINHKEYARGGNN